MPRGDSESLNQMLNSISGLGVLDQGIVDCMDAMNEMYAVDGKYNSLEEVLNDFGIKNLELLISFIRQVSMPMVNVTTKAALGDSGFLNADTKTAAAWLDGYVTGLVQGRKKGQS